jgi:prophage regulatory protein
LGIPDKRERTDCRKVYIVAAEFMTAPELEELTGTPASTWRYWAHIGQGPASFKLGRRRVWKKSVVLAWLEQQYNADQSLRDASASA